ncbi:uncharacterized protein LOC121745902 [Salvia splendens]|uniref:uncharacterized protein LOC121745902 n=1 Tax=Salvia splendens TaxID=180675 RepID=UPI001C280AC9|nr:uncharacterized protein LOC121745902 [Salvia splendens]
MPTDAEGLLNLQIKIARVKKTLKKWNKEIFGNIHSNLRGMEEKIAVAQAEFKDRPSPENRTEINKLIAEYICLLRMEEDFWRQAKAGSKQKRIRMRIHKINSDGREITEETEIKNSAVQFFQNLLAPEPTVLEEPDLSLINPSPPSDDMNSLAKDPEAEEVKRAVFGISGDSAPGPDSLTATFFQACWEIIGRDVVAAISQLFHGVYLPRSVTATSIVLIPKKPSPDSWGDYRPINLCNVINKVITKIHTTRLAPLLPRLI